MKKILIIEDDVFLGDVLVERFNKEGFETHLSRDGKEGFEELKNLRPDLVLLDIILPNMNGYEILEAKQKDEEIKKIPVIIISNSGQPVEINRALELGVKDYFIKAEFDPEEVMVKVRGFLKEKSVMPEISNTSVHQTQGNLSGKKILLVEDDNFLSEVLARKLANEKCILVHAGNGGEGLTLVEKELPDLVLLDILLPGMNGFEVLEKLKANGKTKDIPIVMLSNLSQQSDIDKAKSLGAKKFLIKASIKLDEIIAEIETVLAESKK